MVHQMLMQQFPMQTDCRLNLKVYASGERSKERGWRCSVSRVDHCLLKQERAHCSGRPLLSAQVSNVMHFSPQLDPYVEYSAKPNTTIITSYSFSV